MRSFMVSVKLFLFMVIFTCAGIGLYLLFPAFHTGGGAVPAVPSVSEAVQNTVIVLDPGHGGEDGGAVATDGTLEKDLNLVMAKDVCEILKYSGFRVILTRETDTLVAQEGISGKKKQADLAGRLKMAESGVDNILVSIHMNKFSDPRCTGLQVYYSKGSDFSAKLAEGVQSAVRGVLQQDNNRKIKAADSSIYILHNARVPAILIECGFISSPKELTALKDEEYQKELATVIAAAIMDGVINERS